MLSKIRVGKKAALPGRLAVIVAMIVGFMAISLFVQMVFSDVDSRKAEILCQESIEWRAASMVRMGNFVVESDIKPVPILCKTIDEEVSGEREEVKTHFAESIAKCWRMFGEGRYEKAYTGQNFNLFPSVLGLADEEGTCFNCYNLLVVDQEIESDEFNSGPISTQEMLSFMVSNHPSWMTNETNYLKYIQRYKGDGMFVPILPAAGIEARKAYTVSFLPKNVDEGTTNWALWVGGAVAVAATTGAVICTVSTGGACAPVLVKVLVITAKAGAVTAGAAGTYDFVRDVGRADTRIEEMYKERRFSSIYLSDSYYGQTHCGSGDIAGE